MKAKEELKEIKMKSVSELQRMLASNREKLRDLRFKVAQNQYKNIREIRVIKKKIAKTMTILNQKKVQGIKEEKDSITNNKQSTTNNIKEKI